MACRGAQQQRSLAGDAEAQIRQVARAGVEEPLLAEADRLDVPEAVEDGE